MDTSPSLSNFVFPKISILSDSTYKLNDHVISGLLDGQPDSVMWFIPVFDESTGNIIDFKAAYCNAAGGYILNTSKENVIGQYLKESDLIDDKSRQLIFEQCKTAWSTNKTVEFTYYSPALSKYLNVQRSKLNGGVLNVTRDHTELELTKIEKNRQSQLLNELIAYSPYGVSLYESIRNEKGDIIDFKLKLCNQKCAEFSGFTMEELYKYTAKELMLIRGNPDYFDICKKVVENGKPVYMDYLSVPRNKWLGFSIIKFNDGYLLNYSDINEIKILEKQARHQAEMLEGILNASLAGLFALEAITGFSGKILDFKFTMLNKAAETLLKLKPDDKGKTFLSVFPTAKTNGLFEMYTSVVTTGKPVSKTILYLGDGLKGEYFVSVSKMGENGLVQSFSEIKNLNPS